MFKNTAIFIITIFYTGITMSQSYEFGFNNYIEYQKGTLPIVLSVPHGGSMNPATIPDRICNDPVYATDAYTIETAMKIKAALYIATGCYPHIIICHLDRAKLDCNRNINEGACGNAEALTAWNEFHDFINTAQNTANQNFKNKTLFVDLHGHGNPVQRIELGYLLYDHELELSDEILNSDKYINFSSIKNLVNDNVNNFTLAQLLRGPEAFGTLLSKYDFPSVPSQQIPYPGTSSNYFSGGYITANHTSYASGVKTDGFQMELNYNGIRDTEENRTKFANAFTKTIIKYLNTHFNLIWNPCSPLKATGETYFDIKVFPNPQKKGNSFFLESTTKSFSHFKIISISGMETDNGIISYDGELILKNSLKPGIYILVLINFNTGERYMTKLISE